MGNLTSGIQLAPLSVDIKANYSGFERDMARVSALGSTTQRQVTSSLNQLNQGFQSLTTLGTSISSVGSSLTKNVTLPLAAAGGACTKWAMDFDTSFAKVSTLLDKGTVDYGKYKQAILDNSSKMGVAVGDYSEAVYQSISASVDQSKAIDFTNNAVKLAKGGFTDTANAVDILTTCINAYGMSADDVTNISDKLITTQNLGKTTVNELAGSMGQVIPTARAFNVNIDQVCTAMADMTKNGISTAEASTYLNGMLSELGKGGTKASDALKESTGKTFTELMQSGSSLSDVLMILKQNAEKNNLSLVDMFGNIRAGKGALTLAKDEGKEFNDILGKMTNSAGATDTAFGKVADTAEARLKKKLNELKNEGIELGEKMIPLVEKGIDFLGKMADKFNSLSDTQQENILKWGALAMAVGPFLKLLGGGISTVGTMGSTLIKLSGTLSTTASATTALGTASSVASGTSGLGALASGIGAISSVALPVAGIFAGIAATVYTYNEQNELLNTSLSTTKEELSPIQKLFNEMDGGIIKSRDDMEQLGLVHHQWSDNVAPATQDAIDETADKWQNLNMQMDYLRTNNIHLSPETVEGLKNQTNDICNTIIQEIKDKQIEATGALGEYFKADNQLDTYEQTLLSFFNKSSLDTQQKVQEGCDRINAIYENAKNEHRGIKQDEYEEIQKIEEEMSSIQIDTLSKSQEEMQELQANFNVKMREMDLDGASELMQQKAQERDDAISKDKEYYDTKIEMLSQNINNMNEPQRIAAEQEIKKLEEERDKKLDIDSQTYDGYIKTLQEKYPEIAERIDLETGKILTDQEMKQKQALNNAMLHYEDVGKVTESGMTRIKNTQTGAYEDVYFVVDEKTKQIVGCWNKTKDQTYAANEDIKNELESVKDKYANLSEDQKTKMMQMINSNSTYDEDTKKMAKSVIGQLQGTGKSVNGLYTEVVNCNGTPVEVKVNKDGTIANINEIKNAINNIPREVHTKVWVQQQIDNSWQNDAGIMNRLPNYNSHYNGLDYVPYDGYSAMLHKGERVLTADENSKYEQLMQHIDNKSINGNITVHSILNLDGKVVASNQDVIVGRNVQLERRLAGLC